MKKYSDILPVKEIEETIRRAARVMLDADAKRMRVDEKAGTANFVTEYDVRVQRMLEKELSALLPGATFLAEEEGESENRLSIGYTFIIDPIDGTTNFMLGRRESAISVALADGGRIVFGAVYHPYDDRFYHAIVGEGAFCNSLPIRVSDRPVQKALALFGTAPYQRERMARPVSETVHRLLTNFADIRRCGSAALDLCSVACGEADVFCEPVLSPWDFAAGSLILTEAGGICTDFSGNPLPVGAPSSVLCGSKIAYPHLVKALSGIEF